MYKNSATKVFKNLLICFDYFKFCKLSSALVTACGLSLIVIIYNFHILDTLFIVPTNTLYVCIAVENFKFNFSKRTLSAFICTGVDLAKSLKYLKYCRHVT